MYALGIALFGALPADAYVESQIGTYTSIPFMSLEKNSGDSLNNTLVGYYSIAGKRYRIEMRAGSGNGSKNDCLTNQGWLPDGLYSQGDSDASSFLSFYNKTWGSEVVRGYVWELGSKRCAAGTTTRTELFIHSQGITGWDASNYASNGCIKINQSNRGYLRDRWKAAYGWNDGYLSV